MTASPALRRAGAVVVAVLLVSSVLAASIGAMATASAATKKVDVVFVYDKTGSMDDQRAVLDAEVEKVVDELDSGAVDARYGLVTYASADLTEIRTPLTGDAGEVKSGLGFDSQGGTEDASDAINLALDGMDYRSDATKIIVVITDEEDDSPEQTRNDAIDKLNDEGAYLVAVSPNADDDDSLKPMAEKVDNGRWTDIDSGSFSPLIANLVENVPGVWAGDGPDFRVVETSVDETTVTVGEPVDVTLVVENRGSGSGTYHALFTTMNAVHHSERVEIDAGESHTFTPTVTFDETGTYNLRINYRMLATIEVQQRPPDPLEAGDVELVDAYSTRSTVWDGESYDVVAVVRNVGDETGRMTLEYAGGAPTVTSSNASANASANTSAVETTETAAATVTAATETAVLEPGETAAVRHTVTVDGDPAEPTTDAWTVGATVWDDVTRAGNVTVLPADQVESGVVDAYATPATVGTGEDYDVTAVVHNGDDGVQLFTVYFAPEGDGDGAFLMVWVGPGETIEVHRPSTAPGETGTVGWTVNGVTTSVTVAANGTGNAD